MPVNPEYIPLPKSKEMFAIASWRDSPAMNATATPATHPVGGLSVSPHLGSLDALRNGKGAAGMYAASTTTTAGTPAPPPPPPPPPPTMTAAPTAAAAAAGKKKKRKSASGAAGAAGSPGAHPNDVDDFFVHILLPTGVAVQTLEFELQAQATPLRTIEVGIPKVLFPRKPGISTATNGTGSPGGESSPPLPAALTAPAAPAKLVLSPFCTPAVHPSHDEHGLPPMCLPPADLPEPASGAATAPSTATTASATAASLNGNGGAAASAAAGHHGGEYQVSLLFAEKAEAEKTVTFVQRRWPTAAVSLASRSRSVLNATLVLKGMPNQAKTEAVLAELQKLPHTPSYVRLLRSERGVFKSVVFVKYANCEVAEECKLRLEQLVLGARPLKVEFKKKSTAAASAGGAACAESKRSLQELVRELRVSTEHEGFHLSRADVAKEELKVLKQLCQSYGLLFDMNEQRVTVRRVLGNNGTGSEKPSPALRPQSVTPAWAPATPAPLRPMDFKGISHWKDIRSQAAALGIARPLGPEDGKPAFAAGRGRPL